MGGEWEEDGSGGVNDERKMVNKSVSGRQRVMNYFSTTSNK